MPGRQIRDAPLFCHPSDASGKPRANAEDVRDAGLIPGWEDPLEKGMATLSSILA